MQKIIDLFASPDGLSGRFCIIKDKSVITKIKFYLK